jgi:DNA-directed RNA polymerase subunit L
MQVTILEESAKKLVLELDNPTIGSLIEKELWSDENVKVSAQKLKHPLVGKPQLIIEVSKGSARDALNSAIERAKKEVEKLKKSLK